MYVANSDLDLQECSARNLTRVQKWILGNYTITFQNLINIVKILDQVFTFKNMSLGGEGIHVLITLNQYTKNTMIKENKIYYIKKIYSISGR